jgi:hypothetical protein
MKIAKRRFYNIETWSDAFLAISCLPTSTSVCTLSAAPLTMIIRRGFSCWTSFRTDSPSLRPKMKDHSEKSVWHSSHKCISAWCYLQVVKTSTDPNLQFSASFKAANSRQVQACNISYMCNTKKLQYQNWYEPVNPHPFEDEHCLSECMLFLQ